MHSGAQTWWREWTLEPGTGAAWEIGPLTLDVFRAPGEWIVGQRRDAGASSGSPWNFEPTAARPTDGELERFLAAGTGERLKLTPRVADRSVVARPRVPFHLLPGEEAKIYVSSPIWIELSASGRTLIEVPAYRLSDTWFGPNTREGEVAYSLETYARASLEEVVHVSHRVVTPVVLRNRSKEQLVLERMNLPVPYLSVFASATGELWTERVTLASRSDDEMAVLDAGAKAPQESSTAERLSGPRADRPSGLIVRAFGTLLKTLHFED